MNGEFHPTGHLVDVGGHRLHLLCEGMGSPTVILETGLPGLPLEFLSHVHTGVAAFTRVCSYERAGIGWSDPGPAPRSGRQIARELHTLLTHAGIEPPFVLVAASFGGHYIRLFADQYPDDVAGMVFVDCSHEDMASRFPTAMGRVFPLMKYGLGTLAFLARLGVTRLLGSRAPIVSQVLPDLALPAEQQERIVRHFAGHRQWDGMYAEAAVYQLTEDEVRNARTRLPALGDLPLFVLTAQGTWRDGAPLPPGVKAEEVAPIWLALQQDLSSLSSRSRHRVFNEYTHAGLLGPAGAVHVVEAIRQVVEEVRQDGASS
jgi:pimeloyl-ACP methyl ester carboxylesterase